MSADIDDHVTELIKRLSSSAESILVLGQVGNSEVFSDQENVTRLDQNSIDQLLELHQFDFVLIQNLIEQLPQKTAEHIIAQIRDQHAREMLLIVAVDQDQSNQNIESNWQLADFISLGMKLVGEFKQENRQVQAYYYAVETYKKIPDWLNSKYWANPEMFNKYRW